MMVRPINEVVGAFPGLGFGCAYLTGGFEERRNIRIVNCAIDAGFRHFDTAPLYGIGTSEDVLGKALVGRRGEVTISTKLGRPRPVLTLKTQLVRYLASPIRKLASGYIRKHEASKAAGSVSRGRFDVPFLESSLRESLKRLRTDYVDLLLLHEVADSDITDELLRFLERCRTEGMCRSFGPASTYEKLRGIEARHGKGGFDVVQYSWSALDYSKSTVFDSSAHITHRALARAYAPLKSWLDTSSGVMARLSERVGLDLRIPQNLSYALICAALHNNPTGLVLVSSRRIDRVVENARAIHEGNAAQIGSSFMEALLHEKDVPQAVG